MSTGWTPSQMPDLAGRTAVVTGANSGIGLPTSIELARHGAHVVLAARDPRRGEEALGRLRAQVPGAEAELSLLDLADLASVRGFAERTLLAHPRIDLLVNNAGVMAVPTREITADGFERQLGTNHLGHVALTALLLPALIAGRARVVAVSSNAHRAGKIAFDDLQSERGYSPWGAYSQSKLANLLFAFELQRRADALGVDLVSVGAHPGLSATNLVLAGPASGRGVLGRIGDGVNRLLAQSAEAGASPSLYAATMPDVTGAEYFGPGAFGGWRGHPTRVSAAAAAYDPGTAARLWDLSCDLTGVRFDALTKE